MDDDDDEGQRWLFLQSEKDGILGFGCDEAFRLLSIAKVVLVDGTFRKSPRGFVQIVTFCGLIEYDQGEEWLPLITFLMTGKEKRQYEVAFTSIANKFAELNIEDKIGRFHTDYEEGLQQAIITVFGADRLYGCLFHAVYNQMKYANQECGLFPFYKSSDRIYYPIRVYMRTMMSIFFLPEGTIFYTNNF